MKRLLLLLPLLFMTACGLEKVPAGYVGVKVYLLGGDKGVESEELGVGRYWIGINEELYQFPTFTQNYVWTASADEGSKNDESLTFQTVEGMTVSADVGISYAIDPERVTDIFQKYRRGIDEITDTFLRNMVRDALVLETSTRPMSSVYGQAKADIISAVEARVREQVEPLGINIERIYWIGELSLPETVQASLNAKLEATQRAEQRQNEVEEQKAEAQKTIERARGEAESTRLRAEAEAEANRIISESLTPELVEYRALERWDGQLPRLMGGTTPTPFINVGEN